MNSDSWEKRRDPRFKVPVEIEAPQLSETPLIPEDISIGGFMVSVEKKPENRETIACSLRVGDKNFDQCQAEVIWYRKNRDADCEWLCGLVLLMDNNTRIEFAQELQDFVQELENFVEKVKSVPIFALI